MGIDVTNSEVTAHRVPATSGDNEWTFRDHHGNNGIDSKSPTFSLANLSTMIASAKDGQQSQATFDGVCGGIGNGVGTWYNGRSSEFKATIRSVLSHFPG